MKNANKKINIFIYILLSLFFAGLLGVSIVLSNSTVDPSFGNRKFWPAYVYAFLFLISIAVLIFYTAYFKSHKNIWAFLILVSISISLIGYFSFSLSANLNEALLANKISYFGNVFLLLFSIQLLSDVLRIKIPKCIRISLLTLSCIMFLFSATQGYTDFFYKNAAFSLTNGYVKIIKEYGPGHTIYLIYIALYAGILIFLLIYAKAKKSKTPSIYTILFSVICIINVLAWFIEMILKFNLELLSITYVISEIILMKLYDLLVKNKAFDAYLITIKVDDENSSRTFNLFVRNENTHNLENGNSANSNVDLRQLDVDKIKELLLCNPSTKDLTNRELDVAVYLLKDLKRKDIANNLFVSEDTVKTHTSHIFQKLHVSSREDLKVVITKEQTIKKD